MRCLGIFQIVIISWLNSCTEWSSLFVQSMTTTFRLKVSGKPSAWSWYNNSFKNFISSRSASYDAAGSAQRHLLQWIGTEVPNHFWSVKHQGDVAQRLCGNRPRCFKGYAWGRWWSANGRQLEAPWFKNDAHCSDYLFAPVFWLPRAGRDPVMRRINVVWTCLSKPSWIVETWGRAQAFWCDTACQAFIGWGLPLKSQGVFMLYVLSSEQAGQFRDGWDIIVGAGVRQLQHTTQQLACLDPDSTSPASVLVTKAVSQGWYHVSEESNCDGIISRRVVRALDW